jgi:ribosomal-protein-alanine N-acetyltransferase
MLTLNFNPFPTIATDRLILRQLTDGDGPEIFILRSDERILKFIDIAKANTIGDALAFIRKINNFIHENECIYWGIALKDHDKLIGTICLWNILKEHYRAEVGFAMHPDQQGKGLMNEALAALLNYAFSKMKLHSVEGRVHPANTASIKLMERNKFIREAYFKEDYYCNGRFGDTAVYSRLSGVEA